MQEVRSDAPGRRKVLSDVRRTGGWEKDLPLLPAERGGRGRLLYVLRQAAGRQKCLCGMRHRLRREFLPAVRGGRVFEARGSRTLRC